MSTSDDGIALAVIMFVMIFVFACCLISFWATIGIEKMFKIDLEIIRVLLFPIGIVTTLILSFLIIE